MNNKKFKFIVYMDNKELAKQFVFYNIAPITDYMLPAKGLPTGPLIFEINNKKIYLKVKYNDFEHGEVIDTISEINFNEIDDFNIIQTKKKDVYYIKLTKQRQKLGLNCSSGLNSQISREIVDYINEV